MRGISPVNQAGAGAVLGVRKHRKEGYIPSGKRDLMRDCLVSLGRQLGHSTEKMGLGPFWAEERWGRTLEQGKERCRKSAGSSYRRVDTDRQLWERVSCVPRA